MTGCTSKSNGFSKVKSKVTMYIYTAVQYMYIVTLLLTLLKPLLFEVQPVIIVFVKILNLQHHYHFIMIIMIIGIISSEESSTA